MSGVRTKGASGLECRAEAGDSRVRASASPPIEAVRAALAAELEGVGAVPVVVALSGGLDSCVLLHALRFSAIGRSSVSTLVAAHFDHRMRSGSQGDAAWVRGLCRAWKVELAEGAVDASAEEPSSEDDARTLRYAFLRGVAARRGALLLTAHHADDQAETVLFRALRGTGIEGLAGIPRRRALAGDDGALAATVVRPLLDLTRDDLQAYARHFGVPWRTDPSNRSLAYARNVIRHELIPLAEKRVAAGARRSLARLAEIAGDEEAAWAAAMRFVLPALDVQGMSCRRDALLALGPELGARVLRLLTAEAGLTLDRDTTKRALGFIGESQSGRHIELGRGVELHLKADRVLVVLGRDAPDGALQREPMPVSADSTE